MRKDIFLLLLLRAKNGILEEPRAYKEVLERRDSLAEVIVSPQFGLYDPAIQMEYIRMHEKAKRIPDALISNNEKQDMISIVMEKST